eukprot:254743-Chlamydomonas_euryale.AAC.2
MDCYCEGTGDGGRTTDFDDECYGHTLITLLHHSLCDKIDAHHLSTARLLPCHNSIRRHEVTTIHSDALSYGPHPGYSIFKCSSRPALELELTHGTQRLQTSHTAPPAGMNAAGKGGGRGAVRVRHPVRLSRSLIGMGGKEARSQPA